MKRGDMVKVDAGDQSFFALHEENTWKIIKGTMVNGSDACLVLRVKNIKILGIERQEVKVLTPKGHSGWLSGQYLKMIEERA